MRQRGRVKTWDKLFFWAYFHTTTYFHLNRQNHAPSSNHTPICAWCTCGFVLLTTGTYTSFRIISGLKYGSTKWFHTICRCLKCVHDHGRLAFCALMATSARMTARGTRVHTHTLEIMRCDLYLIMLSCIFLLFFVVDPIIRLLLQRGRNCIWFLMFEWRSSCTRGIN